MRDGRVNIEDHLVDTNNRPIAASVNFEVRYSSPESEAGNFDSPTVSKFVQQQSLDDDQQMLLNIEQNIANLERSLNQGALWLLEFSFPANCKHGKRFVNKRKKLTSAPYRDLFRHSSFFVDAEQKKQNIFQRALGGGGGDKSHQSSSNGANNKMKVSELFFSIFWVES